MIKDGDLILIEGINLEDFVNRLLATSAQADLGMSVATWLSTKITKTDEVERLFLSDAEIQKTAGFKIIKDEDVESQPEFCSLFGLSKKHNKEPFSDTYSILGNSIHILLD